ncbi:MAG: AraC family transcriptional regulator, partial [Treponema sp.]|nr:AraC family transcriptional regulator [Treponema sp.]
EEWYKMCRGNGKKKPFFYVSSNGNIEFVFPFSSVLSKENLGAVVCNISSDEMERLLNFKNEYEEYSLFIYDKNDELIWSNDLLKIGSSIKSYCKSDIESNLFIKSFSTRYGWKYLLVVPQYSALKKLTNLKKILLFLIVVAVAIGVFISLFLSIKNGKPINCLFASLENHNKNIYGISHNVRNLVLLFEDLEAKIGKNELFYPDLLEDNLILSIKSGNEEDTESIITLIKDENCKNRNLDDEMFALLHGNMIATLENVVSDSFICEELSTVPERTEREKFFDLYTKKCIELCSSLWEKKNKTRKELVDKMMGIVNEHFSDSNLGLGKLSQEFNVSESYVSLVFKEQAGQNFQSYLEKIRINNACSLLKNTKQSVEDVSSSCGYYTVQSFRRAFKKVTGFSPTEYRNKA